MSENTVLTDPQVESAKQELIVKFPKVERLPVDPPIAGQSWGLFSFKFLPKPVKGVYGFLKFRGAFSNENDYEKHAENIIRTVDSKHRIWPYQAGRWMPITTNEEFATETLEIDQQDELKRIYNQQETNEEKNAKQNVREIQNREKKLREEAAKKYTDTSTIEYYAQKTMSIQQIESWLQMVRQRKRQLLKALHDTKEELERIESEHPEYIDQVEETIRQIKEEIGLDPDAPIDKPSISQN